MNNNVVSEFLKEIEKVMRRYDLSIGHEDAFGAFIIEPFSEKNIEWLKDASISNLVNQQEMDL